MSELLRLLTKNERMSESLIFLSKLLIRLFLGKNEWFTRKSDERIPSPVYEYTNETLLPYVFFILGK